MTIDIQSLSAWVTVLQFVFAILFFLALLWLKSRFVTRGAFHDSEQNITNRFLAIDQRISGQGDRLNRGDTRFAALEEKLDNLPTVKNFSDLTIALERLSGDVRVANERLEGLGGLHDMLKNQVSNIDGFLREHR